jgi:SpoVK/Ycf46/Vps4 family AAA+-type ATPase
MYHWLLVAIIIYVLHVDCNEHFYDNFKQTALRHAVEWPQTKKKDFERLGLAPPRGILLRKSNLFLISISISI